MSIYAEAFQRFEHALTLANEQRAQWLSEQPEALRAAISSLLRAHQESTHFLEPEMRLPPTPPEVPGYKLLQLIGIGGMGQVWLAERVDGEYQQHVAIKFYRLDSNDSKAHERALSERQFLANLKHPNIAQILDAGSTKNGMPYVIMEYVAGLPFIEYAVVNKLTLAARVQIFLQVLDAIQAAHRSLILHRDLKSANVLVSDAGQVKLLDFGIAKSIGYDAQSMQSTSLLLTPATASPEQLAGEPLTVASDLYSAGLLLYELLTGTLPFKLEGSLLQRAQHLASVAAPNATQHIDAQALQLAPSQVASWKMALRGDLTAIVAKVLRYEPELRYQSAKDFAADLQAWLQQRPVQARAGGRWYALRKFVARNKLVVASAMVGLTALTVGLSLAWQQAQARAQEAERARLANQFLSEMISYSDPFGAGGSLTIADALDHASQNLGDRFSQQPLLEADLRALLGRAYVQLNDLAKARVHLQRAEQIERQQTPIRALALASCLTTQGEMEWSLGNLVKAEAQFREAYALLDDDSPETSWARTLARSDLSQLLADLNRVEESIALAQESLQHWRFDPNQRKQSLEQKADLLGKLAYAVSSDPKRVREAITYNQQARATYSQILPADDLYVAALLNNEGMAWLELNETEKAANLLEQSLAIRRKKLSDNHWMKVTGAMNLARVKASLGLHVEACALAQEAVNSANKALSANDPTWARLASVLTFNARARGDLAEVVLRGERAAALTKEQQGHDPKKLAESMGWIEQAKIKLKQPGYQASLTCPVAWPEGR